MFEEYLYCLNQRCISYYGTGRFELRGYAADLYFRVITYSYVRDRYLPVRSLNQNLTYARLVSPLNYIRIRAVLSRIRLSTENYCPTPCPNMTDAW